MNKVNKESLEAGLPWHVVEEAVIPKVNGCGKLLIKVPSKKYLVVMIADTPLGRLLS